MESQRLRKDIAAAQAGIAEGFESLLATFGPRLYGFFLKATGNHHEAEDLLGEISIRLVKNLGNYDHRGRFEPWLFRIAANMLRDRRRRASSRSTTFSLNASDDETMALEDRVSSNTAAPGHRIEVQEDVESLDEALNQLDDVTRQLIVMRHFGDMSFKEISQTCEMPLGTVLARVHRGLKSLRKMIGTQDES